MYLNRLVEEVHKTAIKKGFWESPREVGTTLMLIVSELSEALEAIRNDRRADLSKYYDEVNTVGMDVGFKSYIKDTFEDELADVIIRVMDLCGYYKIDIDHHVALKMAYNLNRPHKYGKQF